MSKMINELRLSVFAINLDERSDRKKHIVDQFRDRSEFKLHIVPAIKNKIGAIGLWQTMRKIVAQANNNENDYIILCEDDHLFTEHYNLDNLLKTIEKSNELEADLLLGGVSNFDDAIEYDKDLFWLSGFTGFQFAVIYRRFYKSFISIELNEQDNIDLKMKNISDRIFCMFPFISVQKEFGYSDVTKKNEQLGVVDEYFVISEKRLKTLSFLKQYFSI